MPFVLLSNNAFSLRKLSTFFHFSPSLELTWINSAIFTTEAFNSHIRNVIRGSGRDVGGRSILIFLYRMKWLNAWKLSITFEVLSFFHPYNMLQFSPVSFPWIPFLFLRPAPATNFEERSDKEGQEKEKVFCIRNRNPPVLSIPTSSSLSTKSG